MLHMSAAQPDVVELQLPQGNFTALPLPFLVFEAMLKSKSSYQHRIKVDEYSAISYLDYLPASANSVENICVAFISVDSIF